MTRYRRAIRRGHLAYAATLYPAHVRAYNRSVAVASSALWLTVLAIATHLVTQLLP